jgi:hypothetical protein
MPSTGHPRARPPALDAISFLEAEHASTRELLAMLLGRSLTPRSRERVIHVLSEDLWIHMQLEEEIFYPALVHSPTGLGQTPAGRSAIRQALPDLEKCRWDERDVIAIARRMLVLHHEDSEHEEQYVFPHARRVLGPRALEALGGELVMRRQDLRESGLVGRHILGMPSRPPPARTPETERPARR